MDFSFAYLYKLLYNIIMIVGIFFNKNYISENEPYIQRIFERLNHGGIEVRIIQNAFEVKGIDILIVLGGDGTILTVASECAKYGVKIMGINYGHIGFLAEYERGQLDEALELILNGKYSVQKRIMLKVIHNNKEQYALNDLVIQRETSGNNFLNTVNIEAAIDGQIVDNFCADGIIVSTPTGSTAYSLSAGGSVLSPDLNAFILTPICAHSLHSRPIVYDDKSTLALKPNETRFPLSLILDGRIVGKINAGEILEVTKAEQSVEFITELNSNFYSKLFLKLSMWSK